MQSGVPGMDPKGEPQANHRWDLLPAVPVANLAAELLANRNLLSALAGPAIALTVDADGGARPVRLTGEDLTRILVNLVKNASEAMPGGGRIHIGLRERPAAAGTAACLAADCRGQRSGNPRRCSGKDLHLGLHHARRTANSARRMGARPSRPGPGHHALHRGDGGRAHLAVNRDQGGARFEIELPVRKADFSTHLSARAAFLRGERDESRQNSEAGGRSAER